MPELQLYLISLPATATLHLLISVHSFIPSSMTHQQRLVQMRFKQLRHITVCSNLISSSILTLYTRLYTMSEVVAHSSNCNSSSHSCSNSSSPLCSSSSSSFILCRRTETMLEGSCCHLISSSILSMLCSQLYTTLEVVAHSSNCSRHHSITRICSGVYSMMEMVALALLVGFVYYTFEYCSICSTHPHPII